MPRKVSTKIARKKPTAKAVDAKIQDRGIGFDYFTNALARMGTGTASVAEGADYPLVRLSNNYWLMVSLYRNHWIARRVVDTPAQDMIRAWPRIVSEMEPQKIRDFELTLEQTCTQDKLLTTIQWARLFGGAGALIVIEGHEKFLDTPLKLKEINPGTYRGLIPFDRWSGISPDIEVSTDIDAPINFGLPEYYSCRTEGGSIFKIHHSRILRFTGPPVPQPEFQAQMRWGISVLEIIFEEMRKRDNMSWTILNLLFRAQILTQVNPELAGMLSGLTMNQTALQKFYARMEAQNQLLSNQSMLVLPKDGKLESNQYAFGGVADVYQQFQLDIAGAAQIPIARLFGRTISGLGQTNDADERIYEERIAQEQQQFLRPQLMKLFLVIAMSEWGRVPKDFDFRFPSVRILTEEEKANLAKTVSEAVGETFNLGMISQKRGLMELQEVSRRTDVFTSITNEYVAAADDTTTPQTEDSSLPGFADLKPNKGNKGKANDELHVEMVDFQGLPIGIEQPEGSWRSGIAWDGVEWRVQFRHPYGYIMGTRGYDGEAVDCFIGPNEDAAMAYIIRQKNLDGDFDEEKVMLGYDSPLEARQAYFAHYDRPHLFYDSMSKISIRGLKNRLKQDRPDILPDLVEHGAVITY